MSKSKSDMELVETRVLDVRREADHNQGELRRHVVVLREIGGQRTMPIWTGRSEATQIAFALKGETFPRPATYAFMHSLLNAAAVKLSEVRITALTDKIFYAQAVILGAAGEAAVDARPSDAINLALAAEAPIRLSAALLDQCQASGYASYPSPEAFPDGATEIVAETQQQFARHRKSSGETSRPTATE